MDNVGYIYKITNCITKAVYIGQTSRTIAERFQDHIDNARRYSNNIKPYSHLYRAMNKYGINNFIVEQLEECSLDILNDREIYWITFYNSLQEGYNMTAGGTGGNTYSKLTELELQQVKEKISNHHKGKPGRLLSENSKQKISESQKKRLSNRTEEQKQLESLHKSQAAKKRPPKSAEAKAKIAASNVGKHFKTEEQKKYLRSIVSGKIAINKDGIQKYIYESELDSFLEVGWSRGGVKHNISEETKREAYKKRNITNNNKPLEEKQRLHELASRRNSGCNNPMYGSTYIWMNFEGLNHRINPDEESYYIELGYKKGRVKKNDT